MCGQQRNSPMADPIFGSKYGPQNGVQNWITFSFLLLGLCLGPVLGSRFGPKSGVSHRRILLLPAEVLQADLRRTSMSVSVNTCFFSLCVPLCFLYIVHVFDDTVGHSPCVTWQILCFCSGCFVWALAPFFVLLRCFLSMAKRKSGRGICVSSFGFGAFCCACVIRFAVFLMRPLCFMLSFFVRLPAYPNVRTEPQSDIGHNRGKKKPSSLSGTRVPRHQLHTRTTAFRQLCSRLAGNCLCCATKVVVCEDS